MKPKSTHRAPLAFYIWRRLAAAFALLPAVTVTVITTGTIGTGPALADVACRPGSWTSGCATQNPSTQNPALSALSCRPGSSMPGCAMQRPTPPEESPTPTVTALTASFHGLPDAHDGSGLFTFELRFSQEFSGLRLGMLRWTLEVAGGRLVDVKRTVRGKNRRMTVRVRPSSSEDVTVALPQVGWLWGAASATVAGPSAPVAPSALTATFHGLPDAHNGNKLFSFEIRFSEEFSGLRLTALKEALEVTGGRVIDVKRTVRGENRRVTVRVRPTSLEPVTVALGATDDCSAAGAICDSDGRKLSGSLSASVTSPAWQTAPVIHSIDLDRLRSLNPNLPVVKTVQRTVSSSAPEGFPSAAGWVSNVNAFGAPDAPDIAIRARHGDSSPVAIDFACTSGAGEDRITGWCRVGGGIAEDRADLSGNSETYGRWFTYPSNAAASDVKVHLQVRRGTWGVDGAKVTLSQFFYRKNRVAALDYFHKHLDFFKAEAHLEAPGTAVHPTGTDGTDATWTGKVIALDSGGRIQDNHGNPNFGLRGQLVGGDASVTVTFGGQGFPHRATVQLTNLEGANVWNSSYPDLTWAGMAINNGSFSNLVTHSAGTLTGTFRHKGLSGTSPNTVGGTFNSPANSFGKNGLVGGFIATR